MKRHQKTSGVGVCVVYMFDLTDEFKPVTLQLFSISRLQTVYVHAVGTLCPVMGTVYALHCLYCLLRLTLNGY